MAVLAAFGLAGLRRRLPARHAGLVVVALVVLANIESLRAPFLYTRFAGHPEGVLAARATSRDRSFWRRSRSIRRRPCSRTASYVLNSTAHWRPLMNGYSGYIPGTYREYAETFWYFPREHAIDAMRRAGVTHVMIHPHGFGNEDEAGADVAGRRGESLS